MTNVLEVNNLSFSYPDKKILDGVSFCVEKGDFVCIVGTNGTGKSTLIKLVLNLLKPTSGSISLLNQPSVQFNQYSRISYVSQKAASFNTDFPATVEEVVSTGLYAEYGFMKRIGSTGRLKIKQALERVDMSAYGKRLVGRLSGGQQQRVFIARALVSSPDIIFLDEPTVGVDIKAVDSICCLLGELNTAGITIIMVTHDISSVLYHANKILQLSEDGRSIMLDSKSYISQTVSGRLHHEAAKGGEQ